MKKKLDNSVLITLIIVGGVLVLALMGIGFYGSINPSKTVSSQGFSELEVLPDLAVVYFNVQTEGKTSEEAREGNAEIVDEMKNSLSANGFSEEEIQTLNFNIYPKYDYSKNREITGYMASHSIKIEVSVDDSEKISKAIDLGIGSGAGINHINFELTRENENLYKSEAIKLAAENARIKAEALAEGSGKKLGVLVSVSTSDFAYQPWRVLSVDEGFGVAEIQEAVATDINPSEQTISASVTAVFKIK